MERLFVKKESLLFSLFLSRASRLLLLGGRGRRRLGLLELQNTLDNLLLFNEKGPEDSWRAERQE